MSDTPRPPARGTMVDVTDQIEAAPAAPSAGPPPAGRPGLLDLTRARPVAAATLVGSAALLVQVVGYVLGWQGRTGPALVLWYAGYVALAAPYAAVLLAPVLTTGQRLAASVSLTLLLHLSWLLSNPVMATRFDESLHVTTLRMMTEGDGFFAPNTMLPVSPHYPGLELATAGVHWLTGLPLMACQVLVVLVARLTFVTAFFWLATRIGRSEVVGGLAVLLYSGSAQFYFFNAQFSYQTVAIAMLMATFWLLLEATDAASSADPAEPRPWRWMVGVQACLAALTVTHHLTSWLTLATLWLLALLFALGGERRRARLVLVSAEVGTVVLAAWTALIAPLLVYYLGPVFTSAGEQLSGVLAMDGSSRQLFEDGSGVTTPLWEVAVMGGASLLWCALLLPAALVGLHGSTLGRSPARLLPLALAAVYPALLLTRFAPAASEVGDRASTFVTMALAVVVGAWLAPYLPRLAARVAWRALAVGAAVLLLLGGVILGSGPDLQRVPGPYLAAAEQRSVDSETVAVAEWAARYLPRGARIASDSTLDRVLPTLADVVPVTSSSGSVNVTPLFISTQVGEDEVDLLQQGQVDFVVVDQRMAGQSARIGSFFEGSSGYGPDAQTLTAEQLGKFAGVPGFDLVLDGPVQVYDVRSLTGRDPEAWADRPAPGLPGGQTPWQMVLAAVVLAALGWWAARRRPPGGGFLEGRQVWRLAVVLPCLMVVGALGVVAGFPTWAGAGLLALLAGVLAWRWRHTHALVEPGPDVLTWRRLLTDSWHLAVALLLLASVVLATQAAWQGLMEHPPLPAPPAVQGAGR